MLHKYTLTFKINKHTFTRTTRMYYRSPEDVRLINPKYFKIYGDSDITFDIINSKEEWDKDEVNAHYEHLINYHQQCYYDHETEW